jgi:membrane fusion protein, copper/silver efflux system
VIDTGSRKLVYREAWPGVYDGVEVQLGPRSGGLFPVLRGLEAGERVATAGSFLLDAETRLTGGVGSTYFGASGGPASDRRAAAAEARPSQGEDEMATAKAVLAKLSRVDRQLAEAQGFCPVLNNRLGSMGMPAKILLDGQPVFLCCKGCEAQAREHPARTLARLAELKAGVRTGASPPVATTPAATAPDQEANNPTVKANLALLSPEDRSLAVAQRYCPVLPANRLGSMGVPFKVMIQGQPVFLCCDACADEARAQPERSLAKVRELRAQKH